MFGLSLFVLPPASGQKINNIQCVELGGGFGSYQSLTLDGNFGFTGSLNDFIAMLGDYNVMFYPGELVCHEFSIKFGPYFSFFENSFVAFGTGASLFAGSWENTNDLIHLTYSVKSSKLATFMIPMQMKINLGLIDNIGIGIKGTYDQAFKSGIKPRGSLVVFFSYSFKESS